MTVFLIMPSKIMARGIEGVFHDLGEFKVAGIVSDISSREESILRNLSVDTVIVDPAVFAHSSRGNAKHFISEYTDAPVVAFPSAPMDDESSKQYDAIHMRGERADQQGNCRSLQHLDTYCHHTQEEYHAQDRYQDSGRSHRICAAKQSYRPVVRGIAGCSVRN